MAIELSAVSVRLGYATILRDITCTFQPGRVVALIGANGAGKSTLLDCLSGFVPLSGGTICVDGTATRARHRLRLTARLHQRTVLPEAIRCGDFLRIAADPQAGTWMFARWSAPATENGDIRGIHPLLAAGRIHLETPISELSGGQRRLAALAGALLSWKPVLLLDEPFAGISSAIEAIVRAAVRERSTDRVVVLAEHNLDVVERLADDAIVLQNGRITDILKGHALDRAKLVRDFGG